MADKDLEFVLRFKNEASKALQQAKRDTTSLGNSMDIASKKTSGFNTQLKTTNTLLRNVGLVTAGLAIGRTFTEALTTLAEYQDGIIGIGKTTNLFGQELKDVQDELTNFSKESIFTVDQLFEIGKAAGQLGVQGSKDITNFTKTIAKLGTASDLVGEEAATTLARLLNVTNEPVSNINTLASSVVALGNAFAASEKEIGNASGYIGRAIGIFGVGSSEVAALAATVTALGVRAELSGSAIGRTFRTIDASIREGGTSIQNVSAITGIAIDDLKDQFKNDSIGVFQKFVEGLGLIEKQGGSSVQALEAFGLKGDEIAATLPVLATRADELARALGIANAEVANATALDTEYARASESLSFEFGKLQSVIQDVFKEIGVKLEPAFRAASETFREFAKDSVAVADTIAALMTGALVPLAAVLVGVVGAAVASLTATLLLNPFFVAGAALTYGIIAYKEEFIILGKTIQQFASDVTTVLAPLATYIADQMSSMVSYVRIAIAKNTIAFINFLDLLPGELSETLFIMREDAESTVASINYRLGTIGTEDIFSGMEESYKKTLDAMFRQTQEFTRYNTGLLSGKGLTLADIVFPNNDEYVAKAAKEHTALIDKYAKDYASALGEDASSDAAAARQNRVVPALLSDKKEKKTQAEKDAEDLQKIIDARKKNLQTVYDEIAATTLLYTGKEKLVEVAKLRIEATHAASVEERALIEEQIRAVEQQDILNEKYTTFKKVNDEVASGISDTFRSILDGSDTAAGAIAKLAQRFADLALEIAVIEPLTKSLKSSFGGGGGVGKSAGGGVFGSIASFAGSLFGGFFANGAAFSNGSVTPFAKGTVVNSPTIFPMAGGNTGLMGENGAEGILPLKRLSNGALGVQSVGASGGASILNAPINIVVNVPSSSGGGKESDEEQAKRIGSYVSDAVRQEVYKVFDKESRSGGRLAGSTNSRGI